MDQLLQPAPILTVTLAVALALIRHVELLLQLDAQLGPQHGEEARAEEVLGEEEEAELMRLTLALTLSLALTLALALHTRSVSCCEWQ